MATLTIHHNVTTGAAADPRALVDGPAWDAAHTVTGLENVDNTSDANKPVSTAQAAANAVVAANAASATALKADIASPTLTGTPSAPTAAVDTSTTQIATAAFVIGQAASAMPLIDGTAAVGSSTRFARGDHVHPTDTSRAPLASPGLTGTPTAPTAAVDTNTTQIATTALVLANAVALGRGYLAGLTLSTAGSSATFGIAAGAAIDSTNATFMKLASAYTKTTSSWAVGTATGSLDTGAIANSTWYHVHLIKRTDTGVVDVLVSLSATAPTMPTNYTLFRRIGSMKTNGSAQWTKFFQDGNVFTWDVPVSDVSATNPGTSAVTRTLTTPLGIRVQAQITVTGNGSVAQTDNPGAVLVSDLSTTDTAPVAGNGITSFTAYSATAAIQVGGIAYVFTNTSSQVRSRLQLSAANTILSIGTLGWVDSRGRDA